MDRAHVAPFRASECRLFVALRTLLAALPVALGATGCGRHDVDVVGQQGPNAPPAPAALTPAGPLHAVHLRGPSGPPSIVLGTDARTGKEIRANCTTCHATRAPRLEAAAGDELVHFHTGLVTKHGDLTCLTCHDAEHYDRLRLADGRSLEHSESIRLCGQCHGPQLRDWTNGSHGGMAGHWDLARGERTRNHCVVCHDPHAPQILPVLPLPSPNDRFLGGRNAAAHTPKEAEHHE